MSIIKTAGTVSGGMDKGYRNKMVRNVMIEVAIGLIPILGDFIDTFFQANTRNARLLEDMLTARVMKLEEAEKAGHALPDDHTPTNGYSNHRKAGRALIEDHHPITNGHRNDRSGTGTPPRYDDRHAGVHERLQLKTQHGSTKSTNANGIGSGRGWLNRLQSRSKHTGTSQDGGNGRFSDEDVAPARPPRPENARHHPVGSF